jgi:uncharacterized protein YndB with AHSA1/START domain
MAHTPTATISIDAPLDRVSDVINDPRTYPDWLLGAQQIRGVDRHWPEPGSRFHHTVGAGPLRVSDHTTVLRAEAPHELELLAHVGPLGAARVTFVLHDRGDHTDVELREVPDGGLMRVLWSTLGRVALGLGIWGRNEASLQQLKAYVEDSGTAPRASQRDRDTADPAR